MIYYPWGKRVCDVFFSAIGLLCLWPVIALCAILVKLDSKGPVFFRQERIGEGGKLFALLKIRTMRHEADKNNELFEPGSVVRVTVVGKFLRQTKLDEIPQLWNVLKGEMSFVGRRPEVSKYAEYFQGKYQDVLAQKPGITDAASIKYRAEEELLAASDDPERHYREVILPDKLEMNLNYMRAGITFGKDLRIIFSTLGKIMDRG
jgi:lipopolysaccharide/colanic/teichoic acid biosynthesis glycosyltransferase